MVWPQTDSVQPSEKDSIDEIERHFNVDCKELDAVFSELEYSGLQDSDFFNMLDWYVNLPKEETINYSPLSSQNFWTCTSMYTPIYCFHSHRVIHGLIFGHIIRIHVLYSRGEDIHNEIELLHVRLSNRGGYVCTYSHEDLAQLFCQRRTLVHTPKLLSSSIISANIHSAPDKNTYFH